MADRRYAPLKGALPGGTTVKESELTSGDQLAWDATNNTWAVSTALSLPTGTVSGAHLRWSGSAWIENTQILSDGGTTAHIISRATALNASGNRATVRLIDSAGTDSLSDAKVGIEARNSDGTGVGWVTWYNDNMFIRNGSDSTDTGSGADGQLIRIDAYNGTSVEWLARFIVGAEAELYYDNLLAMETSANGIDLYTTSGTAPQLKLFSAAATELIRLSGSANNLYLDNRVNSGELYLRGNDSGGTTRNMITLDPDGGINGRGGVLLDGNGISNYCVLVRNGGNGVSGDLDQSSPGLLLYANGMNTTNRHTPAILFGSEDSAFTTTNPKTLAGIVGRAGETYTDDTHGAMSLVFYTLAGSPGTAPTLTQAAILNGPTGGLVVGSPTGGAKGAGTINASAVYDDNTLLTCMPVEDALGRSNGRQEWDEIVGRQHPMIDQYEQDQADGYDGTAAGWKALMELRGAVPGLLPKETLAERYSLHPSPLEDEGDKDDKPGHGEVSSRLWLAMDYMAVALRDALNKIDELEARLNDDPSRNGQPGTTPTP